MAEEVDQLLEEPKYKCYSAFLSPLVEREVQRTLLAISAPECPFLYYSNPALRKGNSSYISPLSFPSTGSEYNIDLRTRIRMYVAHDGYTAKMYRQCKREMFKAHFTLYNIRPWGLFHL
jgi:hypothetical protein